jgi:type II secretory pathway component PulF
MSLFRYSALEADNKIRKGVIEEIDKSSAARRLMSQGLRPLEIREHKEGKKLSISLGQFSSKKMTRADIEFFTTQIALLLNTGLSLDASLRIMKQNSQKKAFQDFTWEIEHKLKEGKSFSEALADYPMFSSMYINIARAG